MCSRAEGRKEVALRRKRLEWLIGSPQPARQKECKIGQILGLKLQGISGFLTVHISGLHLFEKSNFLFEVGEILYVAF